MTQPAEDARPEDEFDEGPPSAFAPQGLTGHAAPDSVWPPEPETPAKDLGGPPPAWAVQAGVVPPPPGPAPLPHMGAVAVPPGLGVTAGLAYAPLLAVAPPYASAVTLPEGATGAGSVPAVASVAIAPTPPHPLAVLEAAGTPVMPAPVRRRHSLADMLRASDVVAAIILGAAAVLLTWAVAGLGALLVAPLLRSTGIAFGYLGLTTLDVVALLAGTTWGGEIVVAAPSGLGSLSAWAVTGSLTLLAGLGTCALAALAARRYPSSFWGGVLRAILGGGLGAALLLLTLSRFETPVGTSLLGIGSGVTLSIGRAGVLLGAFAGMMLVMWLGGMLGAGPAGRAFYARGLRLGPATRDLVTCARVAWDHLLTWLVLGMAIAAALLAVAVDWFDAPAELGVAALPLLVNGGAAVGALAHVGGLQAGVGDLFTILGGLGSLAPPVATTTQVSLFQGLPGWAWLFVPLALLLAVLAGIRLAMMRRVRERPTVAGTVGTLVLVPLVWWIALLLLTTANLGAGALSLVSLGASTGPTLLTLPVLVLWALVIELVAAHVAPRVVRAAPRFAALGGAATHPEWSSVIPLPTRAQRGIAARLSVWMDVYAAQAAAAHLAAAQNAAMEAALHAAAEHGLATRTVPPPAPRPNG